MSAVPLAMGPKTLEFENAFGRYVGAKHAVTVNSSAAALQLALQAVGLRPGDEVITGAYVSRVTVAAILELRARPVLVDIKPSTLTMDPEQVEEKISERTRAVVPVHLGGFPCEMDQILKLAARYSLKVVEDGAHALPARYKGRMIGSIGDLTAFGFDTMRPLTTAVGGIVTTDRDDYGKRMRARRLHGIDPHAWMRPSAGASGEGTGSGPPWGMSDLNAALGVQQLRKADMFHAIRSYHASLYVLGLGDLPELTLPEASSDDYQPSWHLYIVRLRLDRLKIGRDAFVRLLAQENIGVSEPLVPLHHRQLLGYRREEFPEARQAHERAVSLPLCARMTERDVWDVISAVRRIVERHRARRGGLAVTTTPGDPVTMTPTEGTGKASRRNRVDMTCAGTDSRWEARRRPQTVGAVSSGPEALPKP